MGPDRRRSEGLLSGEFYHDPRAIKHRSANDQARSANDRNRFSRFGRMLSSVRDGLHNLLKTQGKLDRTGRGPAATGGARYAAFDQGKPS
jgi:hypothetical protein